MPETRISPDDARHVAKLARLALTDPQLQKFATQLEPIFDYIAAITQADTQGIEPMAHAIPLVNVLRQDIAQPALSVEQVLQNAPDTDGPFFKVPKVIGGEEDSAG